MPDTASGAQAVQSAPESHPVSQPPTDPTTVQPEVSVPALPSVDLPPPVDAVRPPAEMQPAHPNSQVPAVEASAVPPAQLKHEALFDLTPPPAVETITAPTVHTPEPEFQPTQSMQEGLPQGEAALLQHPTLDVSGAENMPSENNENQPIEPELPPVDPATATANQVYEPITPPAEQPESHGQAPQTTGASMQPIASPEEIRELTDAAKMPEEVIPEPLPVEPPPIQTQQSVTTEIPSLPTPEAAKPFDLSAVEAAQTKALQQGHSEALAERPSDGASKLDEEETIGEAIQKLKVSGDVPDATDRQLEEHLGSGV